MTALDVLKQCREKGIILSASNGSIKADSPTGAMSASLRNAIKTTRDQLLELLDNTSKFPMPRVHSMSNTAPLSPYQEFLWASQISDRPDHSMLNLVGAFDMEKSVSPVRLEEAWNILVKRHHALRTRIRLNSSGIPEQTTAPSSCLELQVIDAPSVEKHAHAMQNMARQFQNTGYNLAEELPIRVGLVQGPEKQTLIVGVHHIVADGWSVGILLQEMFVLLQQDDMNQPTLTPLPFQHQDYVRWMLDTTMPKLERKQSDFWHNKIQTMPSLHSLPTDYTRPEKRKENTRQIPFALQQQEVLALGKAAQATGSSLFMILHTCFRIAMYRFGNELEPVVSVPAANRQTRTELEALVGCFANKVLLHCKLNPGHTIATAVDCGRRCLLESLANQELPYARLLESQPRVQSWQALSQIFFSYNSLNLSGLPITPHPLPIASAKYDLSLLLWDVHGGLGGMVEYDTALFKAENMESFVALFRCICQALPGNLATTPAELELVPIMEPAKAPRYDEAVMPSMNAADSVFFLKTKDSPLVRRLIALAENKQAACHWVEELPEKISESTLIITTLHPLDIQEALENGKLKDVRICFLNTLCHAHNLKQLQQSGAIASLLLEHPSDNNQHITIDLANTETLRGDERYVPATFSKPFKNTHPADLIELLPSLRGWSKGQREAMFPLPTPENRTAWIEGQCIDLDRLARSISIQSGGVDLVLGMLPSPGPEYAPTNLKTELLVVWYASEDDTEPVYESDGVSLAHWVKISAIPLTEAGKPDFTTLSRLPVLSKTALKAPADAQIGPNQRSLPVLHHSDVTKPGKYCPIEKQYTAMGMEMPVPETTQDFGKISQVYGGNPDRSPLTFSFVKTIEEAAYTEFIFINHKGKRTSLTGKELMDRAKSLLHGLQSNGMLHGDKLVCYCPEQIDILPLFWASLLGGYCLTIFLPPVEGQNPEPVLQRFGYILESLDFPTVVTRRNQKLPESTAQALYVEELAGNGEQAEVTPAAPDELIYMAFTSGSTGKPKAVPLMAQNIASMLIGKSQWLGPLESETLLSMTSLDHVASLFAHCFLGILRKARLVLCPVQYILADTTRILDLITEHKITRTWAPEFLWRQLHSSVTALSNSSGKWDLSSLSHVFSGGEPTREATFKRLEEALMPFGMNKGVLANAWGMSETSSFYTIARPWAAGSGQVFASIVDAGAPVPGMSMRIVNAKGKVVPQGEIGSLQVSGPAVIKEYYNNPKANAKDFTDDGWFSTGDLALICDDKLILYGREKEILIIRGQNISQVEVEGAVEALPGVIPGFTAALGCRDAETKVEEVVLFFSTDLHTAEAKAELVSRIQSTISQGFGVVPKHIIPVPTHEIPKSSLGKIQRASLIKRFLEGEFANAIRAVDMLLANERTMPDWFAAKRWIPEQLNHNPLHTLDKWTIFLVGPETGLRSPLQQALETRGAQVVQAVMDCNNRHENGSAELWISLLISRVEGNKTGIVCLLPEANDTESCPPDRFVKWQEKALSPLFTLIKHLAGKDLPEPDMICAITVNGQAVERQHSCSPGAALVTGLLNAHKRQNNNHRVLLVDSQGADLAMESEMITTELCEPTPRTTVALRNGQRFVPDLAPIKFASAPAHAGWEMPFRSDKFCVCTGGLGSVGSALLPHILASTKARLLIIGRKSRGEAEHKLKALTRGAHASRVVYVQADLSNYTALNNAFALGCRIFGSVPGGILHLAADTSSHQIQNIDFKAFCKATTATLQNLQNLESVFNSHQGNGPIINFSTVFAHWGERDFGVYAACSALKESFIHNKAARRSDAGCTLSWALLTTNTTSQSSAMQSRFLAKRGFLSITPRNCFISMLGVLQAGISAAMVGVDRTSPAISGDVHSAVVPAQVINCSNVSSFVPTYPLRHPQCPMLPAELVHKKTDYTSTHEAASASAYEQRMAAVWKEVLSLEHVDVEANFFELGGSSVLLPRLRTKVEQVFGVDIGSTGIFQHASVREMALAIGQQSATKHEATQYSDINNLADARAAAQRTARLKRKNRTSN
ncbi:condensation domain-containing protein [Oleidesulfovibrio sp.]|uniref:condensation domain-containing protein n=1 Tax=Oleidesulfovibrio sp. TaxID=2909707 RepID=UPI003A87A5ED